MVWLYLDTNSFIVYIKTEDIYIDVAKDVETRFDTSSYELRRSLPNVIRLMYDELGVETLIVFAEMRTKRHSYLTD